MKLSAKLMGLKSRYITIKSFLYEYNLKTGNYVMVYKNQKTESRNQLIEEYERNMKGI